MARKSKLDLSQRQHVRQPKVYPAIQRLLGHTDTVPAVCVVCSRQSCGFGKPVGSSGARAGWVCDNPTCWDTARAVMTTSTKYLAPLESAAIAASAGAEAEDLMRCALGAAWAAGITDIAEITQEQFDEALKQLAAEPAFADAARRLLLGYSDTIRQSVDDFVAPF